MITRLSHATIYVLNQDEALKFYSEKLGFEVRNDVRMGDFRWLTVGPKGQPDLELILYDVNKRGSDADEAGVAHLRAALQQNVIGPGVFTTDDCHATYEDLKGKGVEFVSPPQEQPYGIEAIFKDNSGNWFSLTQRRYPEK